MSLFRTELSGGSFSLPVKADIFTAVCKVVWDLASWTPFRHVKLVKRPGILSGEPEDPMKKSDLKNRKSGVGRLQDRQTKPWFRIQITIAASASSELCYGVCKDEFEFS